jgi:hypothetical protein
MSNSSSTIKPHCRALNLFNDINKYLKCECQDNGSEISYAMEHCIICQAVQQFIFELDKEGWIQ